MCEGSFGLRGVSALHRPSCRPAFESLVPSTLLVLLAVTAIPVRAIGPTVVAGEPVQFTDRSIYAPESWSWDFDYDGATHTEDSAEQHPVWTFRFAGSYQVRLEVCNGHGCDAREQTVQVELPPSMFTDDFEGGDLSFWSAASSSP